MRRLLIIVSALVLVLWGAGAYAADCVEVDLWAEVVPGEPLDILQLYFSIENCGSEPAIAALTVTVDKDGKVLGTGTVRAWFPADQPFVAELELPIPPGIPAGTYGLCVSATLGTATDTACATIVLDDLGNVVGFALKGPLPVEETTWGAIKATYE